MSDITKRSLRYGPLVRSLDSELDPEHLQYCADHIRAANYETHSTWRNRDQQIADAAYLQSLVDRQAQ